MRKLLLAAMLFALPARADDVARSQFVYEFIGILNTIDDTREKARTEVGATQQQQLASCVRDGTRFQLELQTAAARMRSIHLGGAHEKTPGLVAEVLDQEVRLYGDLTDGCAALIEQKPGTDYGKLSANAPKITAQLDFTDKSLFQVSPIVFMALIRDKPDAQNHMSHLSITRKERDVLVRTINRSFKSINAKNPSYIVAAAQMIRTGLIEKGYKCADEP